MNLQLVTAIVLVLLRHWVTWYSGQESQKQHDVELVNLSTLAAPAIMAAFGIWKATKDHNAKETLKKELDEATEETAVLAKTLTGGTQKTET